MKTQVLNQMWIFFQCELNRWGEGLHKLYNAYLSAIRIVFNHILELWPNDVKISQ